MDRRKKYTQSTLKECLVELLKQKPITSITVKELCEAADVNRSTFYSHYDNHFDLLEKIGEDVIFDMERTLAEFNFGTERESLQMTERALQYIAEKYDVCEVLLSSHGDMNFKKRVMDLLLPVILEKFNVELHLKGKLSEYIPLLVISGSIAVIERWLENGRQETPEQIAALIHQFTNHGLVGDSPPLR